MAKNNTSAKYNPEESFAFEGYNNEYIGDNESVVPDSDLDLSDIEASFVVSSEVSSYHTDFGDYQDDNGPMNLCRFLILL